MTPVPTSRQVCLTVPTVHGIQVALTQPWAGILESNSKIISLVFAFLAFQPKWPFYVLQFFLWTLPKAFFVGFLQGLQEEQEGTQRVSLPSHHQSQYNGGYVPIGGLPSKFQSYATTQGGVLRIVEIKTPREPPFWMFMRCVFLGLAMYFAPM